VKKKIEKVIKNTNNKTVGGLFSDRRDTKNRRLTDEMMIYMDILGNERKGDKR